VIEVAKENIRTVLEKLEIVGYDRLGYDAGGGISGYAAGHGRDFLFRDSLLGKPVPIVVKPI